MRVPCLPSTVYRLPVFAALLALALFTPRAVAQAGRRGGLGGGAIGVINDLPTTARNAEKSADQEPAPPADQPVLFLQGDDWLSGKPAVSDEPERLAWQSPYFTRSFEFDLSAVTRVRFSSTVSPAWRDHDYRLELAGGDVLYGKLVSVSDANLLFRSSLAGELRIKRSAVRCLERCKANALVYLGPNGLGEWQTPAESGAWRDEEGQLVTDKDGATLYRAIELPPKSLVDFEVSSLFPPVFRLALGVGDGAAIRRDGFRLEVVDFDVIAVYETESDIDVARVMTLSAGPERDLVHLRVLLDQQQQRADVFSAEGLPLASVQVKSEAPKVLPGICLEHKRGGLRFERLRVWSWTGSLPKSLAIDRPQLHAIDGSVVEGTLAAYDPARRQFTMMTAGSHVLCNEEEVARIYFGEPAAVKDRPLRVSCIDGTLLSGWFAGIDSKRLSLDCLSIDAPALESPSLPVSALAGIAFSYAESAEIPNRALVMRFDGGRMHGHLAPGKAEAGQSAVAWLPAGASQAAPLRDDASVEIVAQSLARFGGTAAGQRAPPRTLGNKAAVGGIQDFKRVPTVPEKPSNNAAQRERTNVAAVGIDTIYLPTGDTFKCQIIGIDERGVRCRTTSAEKQIPHNCVKAIDLAGSTGGASWARAADQLARQQRLPYQAAPNANPAKASTPDREKIARLLTLPRLNRDDPPTHILCATNGDYLRGRLLSMSDSSLRFAVGENERDFPRERIAAIVWLHAQDGEHNADTSTSPDREQTPAVPDGETERQSEGANLAHTVCTDGTRLTFTVTEIDGDVIAGVSEILGDCQLPLDRLTELLLGDRVRQAANQMAYHDWSLTPATEPKAFQGGDQPDAGAESPLIGQAAPDFEIELLDGSKFRLSQQKGRAVVLDFWASWCAPCVRTLPKLSRTIAELESSGAMLVAVNLRESADEAKAALARMHLDVTAGLDRDGVIAARYGATSIPCTVLIGPDGTIARVFIGENRETEAELKAALEAFQ